MAVARTAFSICDDDDENDGGSDDDEWPRHWVNSCNSFDGWYCVEFSALEMPLSMHQHTHSFTHSFKS